MQRGKEKLQGRAFFRRSLCAVGLLLMAASSISAAEGDTLRLLAGCPPRSAGCDLRGFVLTGAALESVTRTKTEADKITKTLLIEGSLNGGPTQLYAIEFTQPSDDDFAMTDHTAAVARLDAIDGSPFVFTNKGLLLIETTGFEVERVPNVLIIDRERKRILARYYSPCVDLSFLKDRGLPAMWDEGGDRCVTAQPTGGHRALPANSCTRPSPAKCDGVPVNFTPAKTSVAEIKRIARDITASNTFGGQLHV